MKRKTHPLINFSYFGKPTFTPISKTLETGINVNVKELGEQLVMVVDQLKVPLVLGLGEGAGANILAR